MDAVTIGQWVVVLLFSLSFHEAAHAWSADKLGDSTARDLGRITMNPIAHIDPIMTLLFPAMMIAAGLPPFGAAKPVPVVTSNLSHPKRDHALVAAAGPASNLILMVISVVLLRLVVSELLPLPAGITEPLAGLLYWSVMINLLLAAFNLLPIPPLDGSWVVASLLTGPAERWFRALQPYGFLILIVLIWSGVLGSILGPVMRLGSMLVLL